MKLRSALSLVAALSLALWAAVLVGCSKDATRPKARSLAPETVLTYAPLQGDTANFRVHLFWNGFDPDGQVTRFRYAIDRDTLEVDKAKWNSTTSQDTTLLLLVDPVESVRGHVFWVSAEDNAGNIDPTPAKRFFSTTTIPPVSTIVRGPAAYNPLVPPNFAFAWTGIDPDGGDTGGPTPCESFEILLLRVGTVNDPSTQPPHEPLPPYTYSNYIRLINASVSDTLADARYSDWHWEGIRANSIRMSNTPPGEYVFALRAVDMAGAKEKDLELVQNIRHFTVTTKEVGPTLYLACGNIVLPWATGPVDFTRREFQIFEGEIVSFAWSASAEYYGGTIAGFTFALDDTVSLPPLDIRNTGVMYRPSDLSVGSHFLFIRVVDDRGAQTNAVIPFRILHPTFKDPVGALNPPQYLYVDDALAPGNITQRFYNYPSDAEEDEWWGSNILAPLSVQYGVGRRHWDAHLEGAMDGGVLRIPPGLADLATCRVVIWNVDFSTSSTALYETLLDVGHSELASYLRAGGTLILNGFGIAADVVRPSTALTGNYSRGICAAFQPGTDEYARAFFPREMMGIDGARGTYEALRRQGARDFLEARVTAEGAAMGYVSAEVDTGATAKWNGKIFPGPMESSWSPGLPRIEGWRMASLFNCDPNQAIYRVEDAGRAISTPIFTYHGAPTGIYMMLFDGFGGAPSPREDLVVGVQVQAHDLGEIGGGIVNGSSTGNVIGRIVVFGFPMYFMKDPEAAALMKTAFGYVNASPTLPVMP